MNDNILLMIYFTDRHRTEELEVPADISGNELLLALDQIYGFQMVQEQVFKYYLKADNPKVLIHGKRTLKEFGVRNGTVICIGERDIQVYRTRG